MSFILYLSSARVIWSTFIEPLSFFHCNRIQNFSFCVAWKKETPADEGWSFRASHSFKCNFSLANFINGPKTKKQEEWRRKTSCEICVLDLQRCLWDCQTLTKDLALCDTSLHNLHQTAPVGLYLWPGGVSFWGNSCAQISWRISRRVTVSPLQRCFYPKILTIYIFHHFRPSDHGVSSRFYF